MNPGKRVRSITFGTNYHFGKCVTSSMSAQLIATVLLAKYNQNKIDFNFIVLYRLFFFIYFIFKNVTSFQRSVNGFVKKNNECTAKVYSEYNVWFGLVC